MGTSLIELADAWRAHPLGKRRAVGGINALKGFSFQFALSLNRFLDTVDRGGAQAEIAFEGLSDLATFESGLVYLTQNQSDSDHKYGEECCAGSTRCRHLLGGGVSRLRAKARYGIRCARYESGDPRKMTAADLELEGVEAERWAAVRQRFGEPRVAADPYLALLVRLYPSVADPFEVASALVGQLVRLLGNAESQTVIGEALLRTLSDARKAQIRTAPPRVVTAEDFAPRHEGSTILLGQRPTTDYLARGFFMPRPDRAAEAARAIVRSLGRDTNDERLRVCWLSGASGAGKSVLLLQALEALAAEQQLVLHVLPAHTASLEDALS